MNAKPVSTLGQYQILGELGRGGMAIVYRAYQPALNRTVAIKVLPPQLALDTSFVQRFMLEARNAARLDHPNIVTIHDVGQADGTYFIVMQEVAGESLSSLIQRQGRLPLDRVIVIVAQVAAALDYAHAQGLVHRDIKPGNVIVGPGDKALLTDFGIAKAAEGTRLTQTGAIIGTPEYMSPEQAKGQAVGPASDIYALGIILYEMLAGQTPFQADTTPAVLYKQVHERPAPVRSVTRDLPAGVDGVLARALAKSPGQRYRTAAEMVQALRAVASGRVATGAEHRIRRTAPLVGLAFIAIVAVALIAFTAGGNGSEPVPTASVERPAVGVVPGAAQPWPMPAPSTVASPTSDVRTARADFRQAINAYAGPGREYARMGEFAVGESKDIVGQNAGGEWWLVCCLSGEPVWIDANLARAEGDWSSVPLVVVPPPTATMAATAPPSPTATSPPSPTATPANPVLTITGVAVRVRRGPDTSYLKLGEASAGQQFEISGRNDAGDWWQIRFQDQTGWVSGQYAQAGGNLAGVPVVQAPPPVACSQPAAGEFAGIWIDQVKERIGCPLGPATATDAAYEPFERGAMIWRKDARLHYVIANDGGWRSYADVWVEGLPDFSCPAIAPNASPPTPLRGFGQVWCQNADARQRLGAAIDREWAERMTTQAFERGTMIKTGQGTYVLFADGGWEQQ